LLIAAQVQIYPSIDAKYNAVLKAAGGKPIAIGECQLSPAAEELKAQPG